nr:hypothetical protein [Tanacetum cinerariifolium]
MIFDGLVKNVNNKVSKFLMYPRFLTMCLRMTQFGQITHTQTYVVPFHTRKLFTTLRVNSPSFSGRIVPLFDTMLVQQGEGSGTPTEPHHTPSPKAQPPSHTTHSSSTLPPVTTTFILTVTSSDSTPIRQYTRRARIAQSSALPPVADEPTSPLRDVSQGEAYPTDSGFIADQDRATIAKSSTFPHDSVPRVTSLAADEGSMQQTINELMAFCTSLQRQHSELLAKFQAHEVEINRLKERVKLLEDRDGVAVERYGDDAPIKGRSLDEMEAAAERVSNDSKEIATILTSMDAATILAGRIADVPTGSGSIPTASPPADEVPTDSDVVPTSSLVFATAIVVTPYRRRKGKEVMVESDTPKKQKVQEQIDAQVARELEEQLKRKDQRMYGIETTEEGTKILATIDGNLITVSESSIRRNLKLNDEAGISSLPNAELFKNLTLIGYNISQNQKFTIQKGQFSHQWKYFIHTIMQCLSPKKAQQTSPTTYSSPTLPPVTTANIPPVIPTAPLPTIVPTDTPQLRHYTRRARIAQSSALPLVADEPASPLRDVSQGEACPTVSSLDAKQDRANIAKTSTLPSDSTPR